MKASLASFTMDQIFELAALGAKVLEMSRATGLGAGPAKKRRKRRSKEEMDEARRQGLEATKVKAGSSTPAKVARPGLSPSHITAAPRKHVATKKKAKPRRATKAAQRSNDGNKATREAPRAVQLAEDE